MQDYFPHPRAIPLWEYFIYAYTLHFYPYFNQWNIEQM